MRVSRRDLLAAPACALVYPLARGADGFECVLEESAGGFRGLRDGRLRIFAGVTGWDETLAAFVRSGGTAVVESAAGYGSGDAWKAQRTGLLRHFGLRIGRPAPAGRLRGGGFYAKFHWPMPAQIRDFGLAVPVAGGRAIGHIGATVVAAVQPAPSGGGLIFLGTPVGPSLAAGDAEARAWLAALMARAAAGQPLAMSRWVSFAL